MKQYSDTLIIITGASSGLGKDAIRRLLTYLYKTYPENLAKPTIVGISRRKVTYEELKIAENDENVRNIPLYFDEDTCNQNFHSFQCDLALPEKIEETFNEIDKKFNNKKISILYNCAGFSRSVALLNLHKPNSRLGGNEPDRSFKNAVEAFNQQYQINLLATALCCRLAVDRMDHSFPGYLINVAAMSGHRVSPMSGLHWDSTVKFGVTATTEGLRKEMRIYNSAIRVGQISPGFINTELYENFTHQPSPEFWVMWEKMKKINLMPEDVTNAFMMMILADGRCQYGDIKILPTYQEV